MRGFAELQVTCIYATLSIPAPTLHPRGWPCPSVVVHVMLLNGLLLLPDGLFSLRHCASPLRFVRYDTCPSVSEVFAAVSMGMSTASLPRLSGHHHRAMLSQSRLTWVLCQWRHRLLKICWIQLCRSGILFFRCLFSLVKMINAITSSTR